MNFTSTISGNKALATKAEPSQASRSAARDADLRRRLLQKQHQVAQRQQQQQQQQPQDTAPPPSTNTNRKLDPLEIQHKKKLFQKFKFFLYKIDPDLESKIARKILLLGAVSLIIKQKKRKLNCNCRQEKPSFHQSVRMSSLLQSLYLPKRMRLLLIPRLWYVLNIYIYIHVTLNLRKR